MNDIGKGDGNIPLLGRLQEQAEAARRWLTVRLAESDADAPSGALSSVELHTVVVSGVLLAGSPSSARYVVSAGGALPSLIATLVVAGHLHPEVARRQTTATFPWQVIPGVEVIASPSGQGLSYGMGIALAARLDGRTRQVYVLLEALELEEGQVWEAAMAAAHFHVGNLIALVLRQDRGGGTGDPLARRWQAFGWDVHAVKGNDIAQILSVLGNIGREHQPCPTAILVSIEAGGESPWNEHK